jgi:two-component system cell cycle sensor histidine kinase/response regulator CckA
VSTARKEQRDSEQRFRKALENIQILALELNAEGKILFCSDHLLRITGWSAEEVLGEDWFDLFIPASRRAEIRAVHEANVLERPFHVQYENPIVTRTGEILDIHWTNTGMRNARGITTSILCFGEDVTDRKKVAAALRASERRYRELAEMLPLAVCEVDLAGHIAYANRRAFDLFGYCPEDLAQDFTILDMVDPCDRQRAAANARRVQEEDKSPSDGTEYLGLRKNRTTFPMIVYSSPLLSGGKPVGMLSVITDIRDRKLAEERIRTMADMLDTAPNAITVHDFNGRFLYANRKASTMHGYKPEDFLELKLSEVDVPESAVLIEQRMQTIREKGEAVFEVGHLRKDGTKLPLEVYVKKVEWAGQSAILSIGTDISERRRNEEERALLQEQLTQAQKLESIGRLAGGVAHDFNNMLGVILGHVELALEQVTPGHPIRDDLEEIQKAAQHSADITRRLLTFARRQTVAPEVLDINRTVGGMLKMIRRLIGEDIELVWVPGADLPSIRMDPTQIDQILANLCVNARDAIAGVGKLVIETAKVDFGEDYRSSHPDFSPGSYVMLSVRDDGCGMGKEILGHIFEPFFTTKGQGKGTGLGLATVFGIVKQNHGFIRVATKAEQGSTFRIYLPVFEGTAAPLQAHEKPGKTAGGGETVLLVEDEAAILNLAKAILQKLGYKVLAVATPREAIQTAKACGNAIDLLITDIVMPEMNGRDLAAHIRKSMPDLKCLFMSGYTAELIAPNGELGEGMSFIQKPFTIQQLAARVEETLGKKIPE